MWLCPKNASSLTIALAAQGPVRCESLCVSFCLIYRREGPQNLMHRLTPIAHFAAMPLFIHSLDLVNDVSVMQQVVVSHCMQETQRSQRMPSSTTKRSARQSINKLPFLQVFF